jgi:transcriptional regulator with XRE-family HTH domain
MCIVGPMPNKSGKVTARERDIGARARRFRESINWPQSALAPELDLSRDRLASVEYGRTPMRYTAGYRLCFIFDVNPYWLADGPGEMKAPAGALELPTPETQPRRALFSAIFDKVRAKKASSKAAAGRGRKKQPRRHLIPNFDATVHVVSFLADLLALEKFQSALERQEFALELTSYAHTLALRLRRASNKDMHVATTHSIDEGAPAKSDKLTQRLRGGAERLEREIDKLHGAIEALNPAAIDSPIISGPAAAEVARLQEAMNKIATQIQDAEGRIKLMLLGKLATGP